METMLSISRSSTNIAKKLNTTIMYLAIAPAALGGEWSIKDHQPCGLILPPNGLVERAYRMISQAIPHRDSFYPSCSRYIRQEISQNGVPGIFSGLGRFSRAHIPILDPLFSNVVVNDEVRLYDPPDLQESNLPNHGFSGVPTYFNDCSEALEVHIRADASVGPDPAWGL